MDVALMTPSPVVSFDSSQAELAAWVKRAQEGDASAFDELVLELRDSLGLTVVMVTHDLDTLWRTADRVAFLGERRVLALDTMRGLCSLGHPLVKSFFDGPRGRAARECAWKSG